MTVPVGSVRLYDSAVPDVPGGVYRVRSSLAITADGDALDPGPVHDAYVEVEGPRFTLSPTDVAAVHPPAGSIGAFGERLPHLALTRRTLPWERRFDDGTPWLALVVAHEDEATVTEPVPLREAVGEAHFDTLAAAGAIDGDGPAVATLLATDAITQASLLPYRRDVRLLSHLRRVNLADSDLAMGDDDGWFAVVVANRLPVEAGRYHACLVSFEGREWLLSASAATPTPLVVLHRWSFEVGSGGLFEVLARQLSVDSLGLPDGRLPDPPVALTRVDHDGAAHVERYHGPLRAGSDAAATTFGLDAAAELGRLLGTADGRFLRDVLAWHRAQDLAEIAELTAPARVRVPPAELITRILRDRIDSVPQNPRDQREAGVTT